MASIPLLCNICPKQRKFSDLSHLLTHVGSKGHLSCYFKLQVRSRQDPAAREQLAAHDQWFHKYEVERLLSERLTLKEAKKVKGGRGYAKHIESANKQNPSPLAFSHRAGSYVVVDEQLDPQHSLPYLKSEHPDLATTKLLTTDVASTPQEHVPRMHLWPTAREQTREGIKPLDAQSLVSIESESGILSEKDSGYSTPSISNPTSTFYPDPSTVSHFQDSSFFDSKHNILIQNHEDDVFECPRLVGVRDPDMDGEGTKLKGVFWPGMDIFDSATPEMKRKRNQKKDGSVLEQMMINSAEVEATELVFTPEGKLKKQQRITGMVESSSPMKEESPKPKRRRSNLKKPILTEISGNYPKVAQINEGVKPGQVGKGYRVTDFQQTSRDALATLDTSSAIWTQDNSRRYMPTEDEDSEWRLTLGDLGAKKRSGFAIFADTERSGHTQGVNAPGSQFSAPTYHQPSYYGYGSQNFGQLNDMSLLSSEFHLPSAHTPGKGVCSTTSQDQKPVSAFSGPKQYHPRSEADKENFEPMMKRPVASGQSSLSATDRNNQQYFSAEGGPAPSYYHTIPRHTDFGSFTGPEVYGTSYHPLTYNFQQLHPQQNNGHHTSGYHTRTFASPRRRMENTTGSDPCYGNHHSGGDTFGLDADERILFGEMTD